MGLNRRTVTGYLARHHTVTGYLVIFAATFISFVQYAVWREMAEPGRQYPDPLLPCAALAALATPVVILVATAPLLLWRRLRARRLCHAMRLARAQAAGRPSQALPLLVADHPDAPGRIVWKPDGGVFDPDDIGRVADLAYRHDVMAIVVAMRPAAEQAARILLTDAWQRLCQRRRVRKPCPLVLPIRTDRRERTTPTIRASVAMADARPRPRKPA